ncbi:NAD(P)-dependent oxidoreductase [Insolitispirillum peregrinum]|uniref:precorrin-2 dehydrogenase n=1 Tax=Insolitispirillum peregrinum TaxID=80876 RepID=A0A1N7IM71_9PROT|nr:NAD(P)-dependent oxidoreductase [Insolitispirillum peregrinum]SIS38081.1 precorrin-2 dehydrogenase [Insolitispirillum peregrinum]
MDQLPIFLTISGHPALIVGGTPAAAAKARLVLKAGAVARLVARRPSDELRALAADAGLTIAERPVQDSDFDGVRLVYVATRDEAEDVRVAAAAWTRDVPVNVVDRPELSTFTTPAVVDRAPIVVAVSTGGAAPVLARRVRAAIDRLLPARLGDLARLVDSFRPSVKAILPEITARRRFWDAFFDGPAARAALEGDEATARSEALKTLNDLPNQQDAARRGSVSVVAVGPGDPDLLTLKAHRLLLEADILIHDADVSHDILELARRDASRINSRGRSDLVRLSRRSAEQGKTVVRLVSGAVPPAAEIEALRDADVALVVVPGVAGTATIDDTSARPLPGAAVLPRSTTPASLLEMAFPVPFAAHH